MQFVRTSVSKVSPFHSNARSRYTKSQVQLPIFLSMEVKCNNRNVTVTNRFRNDAVQKNSPPENSNGKEILRYRNSYKLRWECKPV